MVIFGGMVTLAAGCNAKLPGKPGPNDRPIPAEEVLAFDALFSRHCAGCHGKDGKLGPAPPLNDPLFRAIVPATELVRVLNEGRKVPRLSQSGPPETPMAAFAHANGGPLTPVQVQVLIHEIKGIRYRLVDTHAQGQERMKVVADDQGTVPQWGVVGVAPASVPAYMLSKSLGNVERGAKIFATACASCHGANGKGVVQDDRRRNKINDPVFLALISDQALRRIIITGRPDLRMPDFTDEERWNEARPLTSPEIDDLGALLSSWRKGERTPR
jgi:mono/diheme cytochrome c family protein